MLGTDLLTEGDPAGQVETCDSCWRPIWSFFCFSNAFITFDGQIFCPDCLAWEELKNSFDKEGL